MWWVLSLHNLIKIIFSSCSHFLICRCVRIWRNAVDILVSVSELTNQIAAFRILKVITAIWLVNSLIDTRMSTAFRQILTQRHIRKREQDENMILIRLFRYSDKLESKRLSHYRLPDLDHVALCLALFVSSITNVTPGGSGNQIAVFTSN